MSLNDFLKQLDELLPETPPDEDITDMMSQLAADERWAKSMAIEISETPREGLRMAIYDALGQAYARGSTAALKAKR